MAMTSPPYWGLRNYGEGACKIWDEDFECKHEWVESGVYYSKPHHGIGSKTMGIPCVTKEALNKPKPESVICHRCGAWYGQLGLESLPDMYVKHLLQIFRELKKILKSTGSFYLNMGDTYAGSSCGSNNKTCKCKNFTGREQYENKYGKPAPQASTQIPRKSLCMIPERVALAMIGDGWILRNKIIWHKPNPMPSSVKDRLNNTWEYLFHFVKRQKYYYNLDAIREPYKTASLKRTKRKWDGHREPGASWQGMDISKMCHPNGKNPGDVFKITTKAFPEAHFVVYPEKLCEAPIKAVCPESVCKKCGQPKRQVIKTKPNPNAFNIRVRDVKEGRIKFEDRKASETEIKQYQEKKYHSRPREIVIAKGCECN